MGLLFYNLIIWLYNFLLRLSSLFNRKASLIINGRKRTFSIIDRTRNPGDRVAWFHCASLGEFEQGRPIMEILRNDPGDIKIYVSFFSSSGYEVKKNDPMLDGVFYLPADTRSNAIELITSLKPDIAIFVKYEFWYNYYLTCNQQNIPLISISTILRPDQVFFRFYGGLYKKILKMVDMYYVQNKQTESLLKNIGIRQVQITGDTRFDRVFSIKSNHKRLPLLELFKGSSQLIILGSTWKPDIDLWKLYINKNRNKYKYLIAPHHIDEGNLKYIESHINLNHIRFSKFNGELDSGTNVLIMDQIGLLSSVYYYGHISYVGGSFSEGLHNILEPAVYGIPVLMGKAKTNKKYHEASGLLAEGGAFEIKDANELDQIMHKLSENGSYYRDAGNAAYRYIKSNIGASEKIGTSITSILNR
jgi:3-deoxy-D-manno-octulosonic-acid transferase